MPEDFAAAGELLRVLSAPVRLAIITRLAGGPAPVHELTEVTGQSQPLVSQHLRILRSVRLIQVTARGRERVYQLVDDHVAHIVADALRHTSETQPIPERVVFPEPESTMTTSHLEHADHPHVHGEGCGHAAVQHGDHVDYAHDGHLHVSHDGHVDECEATGHTEHSGHDHTHGPDCGHAAIEHGDHLDYAHDGHRHAVHEGHVDEH